MSELIPLAAESPTMAEFSADDASYSTTESHPDSGQCHPIVRLELHGSGQFNSGLDSPIVVDFDLIELRERIDALIGESQPVYEFNGCELSTGSRELIRDGRTIHLRPKVYDLLIHLIKCRSRAVSRDELCQEIWNGRCVGNSTVDSTVKTLRKAVGDDGSTQRLVQTISGYGYRFVAMVKTSLPAQTTLQTSLPLM